MDGATALERLVYNVEKGNVLEPNWAVTRKDGGGTHAVWTLAQPVHRGAIAKAKPIRALSRVSVSSTLTRLRPIQTIEAC